MEERLQKIIANAGICSRRAAEELLAAGRVTVNGRVATLGQKADLARDMVAVDGKAVAATETFTYLMLHKPRGYACTLSDPHARRLVTDLVADCGARVYPVGRLDVASEGLLLLTNDGAFAHAVLHPSHQVDKVYHVTVAGYGPGKGTALAALRDLEGEPIRPAGVAVLEERGNTALLEITIHEGKKRQIRRMCAAVGLKVLRLRRVAEDGLMLGDLSAGRWRPLTEEEIARCLGRERPDGGCGSEQ